MGADSVGVTNGVVGPSAATGAEQLRLQRKARDVSVQFEAMLHEQILKSMRGSSKNDPLFGGGHGEETYRSMLDHEYAQVMAASGRTGIAEMLERQIRIQMGADGNNKPAVAATRPAPAGKEQQGEGGKNVRD